MSTNTVSMIVVYIGNPNEDNIDDYLYVDLIVDGVSFSIWSSKNSLDGLSGEDYLDMLGEALNTARLLSKLGLDICIGDDIVDAASEYEESTIRNVKKLLLEVV